MARYEWNFAKLPQSEHAKVLELVAKKDILALVEIHDKYSLSTNSYCCGSDVPESIMNWYSYAVEQRLITHEG